jgi:hypothetical protein
VPLVGHIEVDAGPAEVVPSTSTCGAASVEIDAGHRRGVG